MFSLYAESKYICDISHTYEIHIVMWYISYISYVWYVHIFYIHINIKGGLLEAAGRGGMGDGMYNWSTLYACMDIPQVKPLAQLIHANNKKI
jgi:hypothetical protein